MTYPFVNFGVGQLGFQIRGVKRIGRDLFLEICFG